jgi:hypothetical protein
MRLTRFGLKGPMWEGFSSLAYPGNQQGIFAGHFTGNVHFLNALFDMGMANKSEALKQRARQGYELTRRVGILRLGWYPSWVMNRRQRGHESGASDHAVMTTSPSRKRQVA